VQIALEIGFDSCMDSRQTNNTQTKPVVKPFIRWAGGKSWFLAEIDRFLPREFRDYYEPFLGGAAVFFHLKQIGRLNGNAVLSDTNKELVDCYAQVRDNVEHVIAHLRSYRNTRDFYYEMRGFTPSSECEKAARFIYLNRTSFNGIYRVNLNGVYNVPYGFKQYRALFDYKNLREASRLLKGTTISHCDFQHALQHLAEGDLVFLDPPYTVAHANNSFIKYNQKIFAWHDQERLAVAVKTAAHKGAYYILTNAIHPSIEALFGTCGTRMGLRRYSLIGGNKAKRELKGEYVFYNANRN